MLLLLVMLLLLLLLLVMGVVVRVAPATVAAAAVRRKTTSTPPLIRILHIRFQFTVEKHLFLGIPLPLGQLPIFIHINLAPWRDRLHIHARTELFLTTITAEKRGRKERGRERELEGGREIW